MTYLIDSYFKVLKFIVVICLVTMVVLVLGNVILRYAFNSGITVSEELARWAFILLTFSGAIIAMREHTHLGVDSLVARLPVMGKKICFALGHAITLYCVILFADGSWQQTLINIGVEAPASGISSGFYYGVGLYFSIPVALIIIYELCMLFAGKLKESQLIGVRESQEDLEEDKIREYQQAMDRETGIQEKSGNTGKDAAS